MSVFFFNLGSLKVLSHCINNAGDGEEVEWLKGILGRVGTKAGRSTSILRMGDGSVAWAGGQREMKGPACRTLKAMPRSLCFWLNMITDSCHVETELPLPTLSGPGNQFPDDSVFSRVCSGPAAAPTMPNFCCTAK